jgi:hypothetical protein
LLLPSAQQVIDAQYNNTNFCSSSAQACLIDAGDARITAAQIRLSNVFGTYTPILATGFATGILVNPPLSQNLWFIQNLGAGNWLDAIELHDTSGWLSYPTIAVDANQDFYLGMTDFEASAHPQTMWAAFAGFFPPVLLGNNFLETSAGTYIGHAGTSASDANGPQRWGDYNTMVLDPFAIGPNGQPISWEVEEISAGGRDESTTWEALQGIMPPVAPISWAYYTELEGFTGSSYSMPVNYPPALQNGDTLVAFVTSIGNGNVAIHVASDITPPAPWSLVSGAAFTSIWNSANSYLNTTNHWVFTRQISGVYPVPASGYDSFIENNGSPNEELQSDTFSYRYAGTGVSAAANYSVTDTTGFEAPSITPSTYGSRILQRVFVSPSYAPSPTASAEAYEDQYGSFVLFNYPSALSLFVEPFGVNRTPELVTDVKAPASGTPYGPWDFTSYSKVPPGGSNPPPPPNGPGGGWSVLLPGQQ